MTDMTAIIAKSEEFSNNLEEVNRAIKRIASIKCRLKKMPGRKTYNDEMTAVLQEEQLLKNVKQYLSEPKKTVSVLTQEDVDAMTYDETCKAIRSVQSKKTHTKWAEDCEKDEGGLYIPGTGDSYKEACRIEEMLIEHRDTLKPKSRISVIELRELLDNMKLCSDLTVEDCIARIENFMEVKNDD